VKDLIEKFSLFLPHNEYMHNAAYAVAKDIRPSVRPSVRLSVHRRYVLGKNG